MRAWRIAAVEPSYLDVMAALTSYQRRLQRFPCFRPRKRSERAAHRVGFALLVRNYADFSKCDGQSREYDISSGILRAIYGKHRRMGRLKPYPQSA